MHTFVSIFFAEKGTFGVCRKAVLGGRYPIIVITGIKIFAKMVLK